MSLKDILPLNPKLYDKHRAPKFLGQPTIVYFHVTVLSIDSINEESMVIRRGSRLINTTRPSRREAFPSRKEMNEEGSVEERRQRADTVGCDVSHLSKALESREFQPSKLVFVFFFSFFAYANWANEACTGCTLGAFLFKTPRCRSDAKRLRD